MAAAAAAPTAPTAAGAASPAATQRRLLLAVVALLAALVVATAGLAAWLAVSTQRTSATLQRLEAVAARAGVLGGGEGAAAAAAADGDALLRAVVGADVFEALQALGRTGSGPALLPPLFPQQLIAFFQQLVSANYGQLAKQVQVIATGVAQYASGMTPASSFEPIVDAANAVAAVAQNLASLQVVGTQPNAGNGVFDLLLGTDPVDFLIQSTNVPALNALGNACTALLNQLSALPSSINYGCSSTGTCALDLTLFKQGMTAFGSTACQRLSNLVAPSKRDAARDEL